MGELHLKQITHADMIEIAAYASMYIMKWPTYLKRKDENKEFGGSNSQWHYEEVWGEPKDLVKAFKDKYLVDCVERKMIFDNGWTMDGRLNSKEGIFGLSFRKNMPDGEYLGCRCLCKSGDKQKNNGVILKAALGATLIEQEWNKGQEHAAEVIEKMKIQDYDDSLTDFPATGIASYKLGVKRDG